jgi:PAS domain S-box-containing protein
MTTSRAAHAMISTTGLSASELAAVLEQLPSGVVVVDRSGQPLLTNHVARRLLDAVSDATPLGRALRGEAISAEEYTIAAADGEDALRVHASATPLYDRGGAGTGVVSMFTDVSSQETLASRQQRLNLALEASHMGTWDYDVEHDRVECSAEMSSIVGAPLEELTGALTRGFQYLHPDDRVRVEHTIVQALAQGPTLHVETRIQRGVEQRVRWLMINGHVSRDKHGRALRMTGIAMDITERKEAQAARDSMAHGERLRALGEMAGGIAHELAQSLTLITGYSEIAHQELDQKSPQIRRLREMVEITASAALEGGEALRGLLSFVGSQQGSPEAERIDVGELLHNVARLTAPRWRDSTQAEGRPVELTVLAGQHCAINGSPAALREAITNLIFNAVDALPRGGTIKLVTRREGGAVVVEVRDSGTGIPPDVQAHIFDPFFTTKGAHGTGLGLPHVLAIVKRHGGSMDVVSTSSQGTTFRLQFAPAISAAASEDDAPDSGVKVESEAALGAPKRRIRILVVEDELQLARMAGLVLSQPGHAVVVAPTGEDALEQLERERFDLIISDLGLGSGKNGWDLAQVVRERWPKTHFVLVTGWGAGIDLEAAHERGVHEVLPKPYRIADLRQVADNVAGQLGAE